LKGDTEYQDTESINSDYIFEEEKEDYDDD
jgi:hypothetical protein